MTYLDKLMEKLSELGKYLPELSDKEWQVGGKTVKLWPFLAVGITVLVLVVLL